MIWILLPAYNEERSFARLLPKIDATLNALGRAYHIVVVDDGSEDSTPALLADYARTYPLTVVTHRLNRGLGETERDGFEYIAEHSDDDDIIVRLDCDDTHEPEYIARLIARSEEGYDVVSTSRFQPGGGQKGVDGIRAFISYGANCFMRVLFPIPNVRDYSCGFRAYRAGAIKHAIEMFGNDFLQLRGLGFTTTLETIVKLHLMGCRFSEVPFILRYDQKTSNSKMIASITTLGYLVMAVLNWWPFGGWRSYYRGLDALYRTRPAEALARFGRRKRAREPVRTF